MPGRPHRPNEGRRATAGQAEFLGWRSSPSSPGSSRPPTRTPAIGGKQGWPAFARVLTTSRCTADEVDDCAMLPRGQVSFRLRAAPCVRGQGWGDSMRRFLPRLLAMILVAGLSAPARAAIDLASMAQPEIEALQRRLERCAVLRGRDRRRRQPGAQRRRRRLARTRIRCCASRPACTRRRSAASGSMRPAS